MKLKFVATQQVMKTIIDAVSCLENDVKIDFNPDGLKIKTVDPANVAMVNVVCGREAFETFEAETGMIAVDLGKLRDLVVGKDNVTIALDDETKALKIGVGRAAFMMSLIDPTSLRKEPKLPDLDLPAAFGMPGQEFLWAINSAEKVSDHVTLEQNETKFIFSCRGDIDAFRMAIPLSEAKGTIARANEARSVFSLDYLKDIAKVGAKAEVVTVCLGVDYPCEVLMSVGTGISIKYMVAPRIETE